MKPVQPANPLHGLTLATILDALVAHYGWHQLGLRVDIRCFTHDPSVASSLKFLRRTPWARDRVEALYLHTFAAKHTTGRAATRNQTGDTQDDL